MDAGTAAKPPLGARVLVSRDRFARLLAILAEDGFDVVGPTVHGGAITTDRIRGIDDLPRGVGDEQGPGRYRLRERGDDALFGWAVGPNGPKRELFAPRAELVQLRRGPKGLRVEEPARSYRPLAFVGVRPCEVAAILVQDRTFLAGHDPDYAARRAGAFVLAVSCGDPGGTCFCASMGTGPRARTGFDLAAVELVGPPHRFVVDVGTEDGAARLARAGSEPASEADLSAADARVAEAERRMGRHLDTDGLKEALQAAPEHPRWVEVADRCLGCTNCTMACPTCFCSTVEDTTDLSGDLATRSRRWDSCFTMDFAFVHGGTVRPSLRARYRQWLTHKLASWHDQFGTSGCVGCGRCITWCPVGIDITEEAAAVRTPPVRGPHHG